jgi:F-type H+-transporting ATPase subunit delta
MILSAVAARYANALAEVVTGPKSKASPQQVLADLRAFEAVLEESHELHEALITPAIPGSKKRAVIGRLADRLDMSGVTRNFLFVLVDHRRIAWFSPIVQTFEEVMDRRLGFARAEVSSATQLTPEQEAAVNGELERVAGKRIRSRFKEDPALIGGAVARIGSTVYDGSVRGQLAAMERRLSGEDKG